MPSKPVYARVDERILQRIKEHATATGRSVSAAIEGLVRRGLGDVSSEGRSETLEVQVASLSERIVGLDSALATANADKALLGEQLESYRAKASLALSAQKHATTLEEQARAQSNLIDQFRDYLSTNVATCGTCRAQLRLADVGQGRCNSCGGWKPEWLPDYRAPSTPFDELRNAVAIVGAATIVAALLDALNSGQRRT